MSAQPNSTPPTALPRVLGPWIATAIVVGTVIGSGVFKKPYAIAKDVPEFGYAMLAWILGGVLAILGALAYAEVATLYPKAGGNYVFLREAFGRYAGFLWGWVDFWIIRTGSIAALASVFSEQFHEVIREIRGLPEGTRIFHFWIQQLLTVSVITALALVNIRGVKWSGVLQFVVTLVKVVSLLSIIVLPFAIAGFISTPRAEPSASLLQPIWMTKDSTLTISKFGAAMVGVIWAYHGWMNIGPVAEEVKQPQRNIPLALILGVGIVTLLYLGANLGYHLIVPRAEMLAFGKNTTVATLFSRKLLGSAGGAIASAAIMISVFGALNGNILVGPRLLFAMGEDRLAPRWLHSLSRYQTPAWATVVMCAWACLMVLIVAAAFQLAVFGDPAKPGSKPPFDVITDFAMFGAVALETLAVMAIMVFRQRYPNAERPYRCLGYPVLPIVYFVIMLLVWINMFFSSIIEAATGIVVMLAGSAVYFGFLRKR
jgi:amino acid transporter